MRYPNCKTPAQQQVWNLALEALVGTLEALFQQDEPSAQRGEQALLEALEAARVAGVLAGHLEATPEAAGPSGDPHRAPMAEGVPVQPYSIPELLDQISNLTDLQALRAWYSDAQPRLAQIPEGESRHQVYDAVRARQHALTPSRET